MRAAVPGQGGCPPALPAPLSSFVGRDASGPHWQPRWAPPGWSRRSVPAGSARPGSRWRWPPRGRPVPGGAWYADLVPVTDPALLAAAVRPPGRGRSSPRPARTCWSPRSGAAGLLILDNCEHLVNAVAMLVERLLTACPDLAVLVTSRIRLVVPHERCTRCRGCRPAARPTGRGPGEPSTGAPPPRAGGCQRARPAAGDGAPSRGAVPRLDGLALAIELAAARLPALGLDGLGPA